LSDLPGRQKAPQKTKTDDRTWDARTPLKRGFDGKKKSLTSLDRREGGRNGRRVKKVLSPSYKENSTKKKNPAVVRKFVHQCKPEEGRGKKETHELKKRTGGFEIKEKCFPKKGEDRFTSEGQN